MGAGPAGSVGSLGSAGSVGVVGVGSGRDGFSDWAGVGSGSGSAGDFFDGEFGSDCPVDSLVLVGPLDGS